MRTHGSASLAGGAELGATEIGEAAAGALLQPPGATQFSSSTTTPLNPAIFGGFLLGF